MRVAKMSVIAALLLGTGAYAIENVKVAGDAKLFYGTQSQDWNDMDLDGGLFEQGSSYADAALTLCVTADLTENVSTGVSAIAVSTLGLENNLVSGVWSGAHEAPNGAVDDASWVSEAWLAGTLGKTTGKVGRQTLETPLVFTERWSVDYNSFEAAVLINEDIPSTTLVGAWIGKSNGFASDPDTGANLANLTSAGGKFNSFYNGAYMAGVTNNSFEPLTAQAWYYDLQSYSKAYWLQADLDMDGVLAGAQYTNIGYSATGDKDNTAYAVMLGYAVKDVVTIKAAYSSVDDDAAGNSDDSANGVVNFATNGQVSGSASSLYTEMWWWFNTVSQPGADSYSLTFEGSVEDVDLFLGLYSSDIQVAGGTTDEVDEITFTASKSFGPLDTSVALIYDMFDTEDVKSANYVDNMTTFQLYLTYNF